MKRASELFTFDEHESASPFVNSLWQTSSGPAGAFMSVAATQWEIVVARQPSAAGTWVTVRGPETRATPAPVPGHTEFFGIVFGLGTFMPSLDMRRMADSSFDPPFLSEKSFWLAGQEWELPRPDNADAFVDRLERAGLLVHDPVVVAALDGSESLERWSRRTVERRVAQATGLTRGTIRQIRRAERAVELLSAGVPAGEVVVRVGYADQPHLARSLKRFVGQTPTRVATGVALVQDTGTPDN